MSLPSVTAAVGDARRDTVRLVFDDKAVAEYSIRGGIAWPTLTSDGQHRSVIGCAVICGLNVDTDTVVVFDHCEFNAIEPQLRGGKMVTKPLAPALARWAAVYLAQRYYWSDTGETHASFRRQIYQCDDLQAKPSLIEVQCDPVAAVSVLWLAAGGGRLKMNRDLFDAVKAGESNEDNPAKHSILCALIGFQRNPWAPPME
jgi:hypothetical protein